MNRKQAENILDAFVLLSTTNAKAASDSLREVILDAMTNVTYYPLTISSPKVTPYTGTPYVEPSWTHVTCANGQVAVTAE